MNNNPDALAQFFHEVPRRSVGPTTTNILHVGSTQDLAKALDVLTTSFIPVKHVIAIHSIGNISPAFLVIY